MDSQTAAIVYEYNQQQLYASQMYQMMQFQAWELKVVAFVLVIVGIAVVGLLRPRIVEKQ